MSSRLLAVALLALAVRPAPAQTGTLPAGGAALEVETRERWLHGRQQPGFTPFRSDRRWLLVDSIGARSQEGRTLRLSYPAFGAMRFTARVRTGTRGESLEARISWPALAARNAADSARLVGYMVYEGSGLDGRPTLPETRLWDAIPTLPAAPRAGAEWADTFDLDATRGDVGQALSGVRWSAVVGDTLVEGRRLWVVRDSARVRYRERWTVEELTMAGTARVSRDVEGVVRGRHLVDPESGLFRSRADTARLEGEAILRYPDGRSFRTPARFERTRHWTLHDPPAHAARLALLAKEGTGTRGSALRDYGEWTPESRARILAARWAAGDTAGVVRETVESGFTDAPGALGADTVARLLPLLADPGVAFAFGLERDPLYADVRQALLSRPPASAAAAGGGACTPAGCALLAAQWESAREPRLRELGLIARLVTEPGVWSDTVLARAAAGSTFLQPAVRLIRGIGSRDPVPPEGADWRAWRAWTSGLAPALISPVSRVSEATRRDPAHVVALRFFMALSGRDVTGELQRALAATSADSARLVYATVLMGLHAHHPDPAEVATRLRDAPSAARDLARRELLYLLGDAPLVGWRENPDLLDGLLRFALAGEEVWPRLNPDTRRVGFSTISPRSPTTFLMADSLSPALRADWRTRANLLTGAEWARRLATQAAVFVIPTAVERLGPFARLSLMYEGRLEVPPGDPPRGYAGGVTVYLLETDDGWVLEGFSEWVT